jgi:hypothetical protein
MLIETAHKNYFQNNYFFSNEYGVTTGFTNSYNLFYGNTFFSNMLEGMNLRDGTGNMFFNDTFAKNSSGIEFTFSDSNLMLFSVFKQNPWAAIVLGSGYANNCQKIINADFSDNHAFQTWYTNDNSKIILFSCLYNNADAYLIGTSKVLSLKHNKINGLSKVFGDYVVSSEEVNRFNYLNNSYGSFCSVPILFRGLNHVMSAPETNDATTTTEVWFVTYRAATSNWEVKGTVSGLQSNRATSGVLYTSDNGQVKFTITESSPQEGDQFIFVTVAAAGDANVQKKILFGPTQIAELNHQSRLVVNPGGKIALKGTADFPTLVDYDGTGGYGFVISGEVDAEYFDFNQINGDGVKIEPTATITKFDNGSIRNVSGLGPHLSINGKDHTLNYLNFDNTGAYDVKASNDADLVFVRSKRQIY